MADFRIAPDEFTGTSCSPDLRLQILHRIPIFADLSHENVHEINAMFREVGLVPGEEIISAGTPAERLYIVAAGVLKVTSLTSEGDSVTLDLLAPGDLFGGLPMLGQSRNQVGVEALTACCVLGVDSADFRQILIRYPASGPRTVAYLGQSLGDAQELIRLLARADLRTRLAALLVRLADKFGWSATGASIRLPLSQRDLADIAGTTVESVNRQLTHFRTLGLVETGRGWISVLDSSGLNEIGQQVERSEQGAGHE